MNERQLKVIRQRIATGMSSPPDALALADEVVRLRAGLELIEEQWDDFTGGSDRLMQLRKTIRSLLEG